MARREGAPAGRGARRYGRRTVVRVGALSGAAAFLAACSASRDDELPAVSAPAQSGANSSASATQAAAAEPPRAGGMLRESTITQAPHFSPFHPGADPSFVNTWRRTNGYYEYTWVLKDVRSGNRLAPRGMVSIEQPDETTYLAKLQPMTFHNRAPVNGRAVTAEDVTAVVEFLKKPPANGGSFIQSGNDLKSATAVDATTVRYETHGPRAFFYEQLTRPIVPKEMLDERTLKEQIPVGSGPYEYKTHTQGSIEEVRRFANFRLKPSPYIDEKKLTFMPDSAAIEAAFRSNQIDAMEFQNVKQRDSVARDLGERITTIRLPSTSGMALVVNVNRAPWNDQRVREAIYRAIDVDRIINTIYFGDAEKSWYFSKARTERNPVDRSQVEPYVGYDPKKAADLLKASGIDLSKEYDFMVPVENQSWTDGGRLASEDLLKVGLKTKVSPIVRNIYLQRGGPKPGDFDITMSVYLEYHYAKTNSGQNWDSTSLQDPEVDALVTKIEQTVVPAEQDKLAQEFQLMLARKHSNFMPLLSTNIHYGWYSYLKGMNPDFGRGSYTPGWQDTRWLDK